MPPLCHWLSTGCWTEWGLEGWILPSLPPPRLHFLMHQPPSNPFTVGWKIQGGDNFSDAALTHWQQQNEASTWVLDLMHQCWTTHSPNPSNGRLKKMRGRDNFFGRHPESSPAGATIFWEKPNVCSSPQTIKCTDHQLRHNPPVLSLADKNQGNTNLSHQQQRQNFWWNAKWDVCSSPGPIM